jgi:rhodanese-related sulfurtransferase
MGDRIVPHHGAMLKHAVVTFAVLLPIACASTPAPEPAPPVAAASADAIPVDDLEAVKAKLAAGAVLVDVRPASFAAKQPFQATNIPFDEAEARVAEFEALVGGDKTRPVVVACGNGSMALKVRDMLKAKGFTDVSAQAIGNVGTPTPAAG